MAIRKEIRKDFINPAAVRPQLYTQETKKKKKKKKKKKEKLQKKKK